MLDKYMYMYIHDMYKLEKMTVVPLIHRLAFLLCSLIPRGMCTDMICD